MLEENYTIVKFNYNNVKGCFSNYEECAEIAIILVNCVQSWQLNCLNIKSTVIWHGKEDELWHAKSHHN